MIVTTSGSSKSSLGCTPRGSSPLLNLSVWNFLIHQVRICPTLLSALCVSKTVLSAFKSFQGPYASSVKEPDTYFEVEGQQLPSIVVELGWSESKEQLRSDMKLWLVGGAGQVRLVLLPKWSKYGQGKISGVIEMWSLDNEGNETLLQTAVSFARDPSLGKVRNFTNNHHI